MMHYSVQARDRIFVKGNIFLSFAKSMGKNTGRNISKNFRGTYSQKRLDHTKKSATDSLKPVLKRAIQKTADATGDLIINKIADKIIKVSRTLPQNSLETVENECDEEIPKEIYISLEERQKIINDLRLI